MSTLVPPERASKLNILALVALFGPLFYVASAMLLPFFSEYGFVDLISELALGRYGFVQTVAFFALGLSSLALAFGIRQTTRGSWGSRAGSYLIGVWGIGEFIAGGFTGALHVIGVLGGFLCVVVAMFVLSRTFKRNNRWQSHWPLSLVLAAAALGTFFLAGVGPRAVEWEGIYQRVFVGTLILWLVLAAVRLRLIAAEASNAPSRVR
jgi:hypothetical protein